MHRRPARRVAYRNSDPVEASAGVTRSTCGVTRDGENCCLRARHHLYRRSERESGTCRQQQGKRSRSGAWRNGSRAGPVAVQTGLGGRRGLGCGRGCGGGMWLGARGCGQGCRGCGARRGWRCRVWGPFISQVVKKAPRATAVRSRSPFRAASKVVRGAAVVRFRRGRRGLQVCAGRACRRLRGSGGVLSPCVAGW